MLARYILDTIRASHMAKESVAYHGPTAALILRSPMSVDIGGDSQRDAPPKVYNRVIVGD